MSQFTEGQTGAVLASLHTRSLLQELTGQANTAAPYT